MRKNLFLFLFLVLSFASLQGNTINLTLKDGAALKSSNVDYIYLYRYIGTHFFVEDSIKIKGTNNEKLTYRFPENNSEVLRIGVAQDKTFEIFYSTTEDISIELSGLTSNPVVNANYKSHNDFRQFRTIEEEFQKNSQNINKEMSNLGRQMIPQQQKDSLTQILRQKHNQLISQRNKDLKNLKAFSSDKLIQSICDLFITEGLNSENFFNKVDFNYLPLARGNFIYQKIELYLNYVPFDRVSIGTELSNLFKYTPQKNLMREALYEASIIVSYRYNKNYAEQYSANYTKDFPSSELSKYFKSVFPPAKGSVAPEIISISPSGKILKLSDLKGKVVLIDFWASWCGPCKRELPYLVDAYKKYKDRGFEVYSVSLDMSKANWENAIAAYGLSWEYHVSELKKFQAKAVKDYRVSGIPATFLIDQNGIIIAKNLRGHQLEETLEKVLK